MKLCTICGDPYKNKDGGSAHKRCPILRGSITCPKCFKKFQPLGSGRTEHVDCRGDGVLPKFYQQFKKTGITPSIEDVKLPAASPMKQAIFDLETWGLDRTWGVIMCACILVHGDGKPKLYQFDLTQYPSWPDKRSDDSRLVADVLSILEECSILYAHNGNKFDIPYLNASALKYGLPPLLRKLVDPVQIARNKFRLGSNALGAIGAFLGIEEKKLGIPADVWKEALLDNKDTSWKLLRERCKSDVIMLNEVSRRVAPFVGMLDFRGSAYK